MHQTDVVYSIVWKYNSYIKLSIHTVKIGRENDELITVININLFLNQIIIITFFCYYGFAIKLTTVNKF